MASHLTPHAQDLSPDHIVISLFLAPGTLSSPQCSTNTQTASAQALHTACSSACSVLLQIAAQLTPSSPRGFLLKCQGPPDHRILNYHPSLYLSNTARAPALLCPLMAIFFSLFTPIYFYSLLSISYFLPLGCKNFHSKRLAFAHF